MNRLLRHKRIRKKLRGTSTRPRLCAYRSLKGLWVQIINDDSFETLVSAHHKELNSYASKMEQAKQIGILIAKKALEKNVLKVIFDRSGYKYHGRIKALADGAREGGLQF